MTDLDICVCTYRRPELAAALASLAQVRQPDGITVQIRVIDNDDTPSAQKIVQDFAKSTPTPVHYHHCPKENISVARNGALRHSTARYLAFIDDDEVATPDWLIHLLDAQKQDNAAAVLGPVDAVYAPSAPAWMRRLAIHETRPVWVDGKIITGYTCNVLIDRQHPAIQGKFFDLALGKTGGEDTKYFTAVHEDGGRIAYAPNALLHEDVPPNRASTTWLLKRRFRMGQTHGRLLGNDADIPTRLRHVTTATAKIIYCAGTTALGLFTPTRRNKSILRAALHLGTLSGLLGVRELRQYGAAYVSQTKN